jgi:hypothetical protein
MDIQTVVAVFFVAKAWLAANSTEVLAVVGACYTIALFIVKVTPTPRDNELLERVHGIVIGLIGKLGIKK